MKQYISPSTIAFELHTPSLMIATSNGTEITAPGDIQTQKKGGGIPWEDSMDNGKEKKNHRRTIARGAWHG